MDVTVALAGRSVGQVVEKWKARLYPAVVKECLRLANIAGGEIARQAIALLPGGRGALARSFLPARLLSITNGEVKAGAISDLPYARVQNEGGTIKPSTRKMLAIPQTAKARSMWPRDWAKDELFLVPKGPDLALLMSPGKGKRGKPKLQYILKPSVKIEGTGYIDHAADATKLAAAGESPEKLSEALEQDEQGGGD
jgi:hypothetical protein